MGETNAIKRMIQLLLVAAAPLLLATGCMDYGPATTEAFATAGKRGLFIACEGNFCYGNATLSFYLPDEKRVENEVFVRANGVNLGDVAQSMCLHNGKGYIVVNNSGIIYEIDPTTFRVTGTITGLTSPRYIHFVDDRKAYITDLYDPHIAVVDLTTLRIVRRIPTNGHRSTEQMAQWGRWLFTNCWSYDDQILVFDTETDTLIDSIQVGRQPSSLLIDCNDKLWTITDGEELYRIDAATRRTEQIYRLSGDSWGAELALNGTRDTLYYLDGSVWRMPVTAERLPATPFIPEEEALYYGLAVDPITSEVYVADAVDYVQPGTVYRYTVHGELIDRFRVGITPAAFCFRPANP